MEENENEIEIKPKINRRKMNKATGVNIIIMIILKFMLIFIKGFYDVAIIFDMLINIIFLAYIILVLVHYEKINTFCLSFIISILGFFIILGSTMIGDYSLSFLPLDEFTNIFQFVIFSRVPLMILFFVTLFKSI